MQQQMQPFQLQQQQPFQQQQHAQQAFGFAPGSMAIPTPSMSFVTNAAAPVTQNEQYTVEYINRTSSLQGQHVQQPALYLNPKRVTPAGTILIVYFGVVNYDIISFIEDNLEQVLPNHKFRTICFSDITLAREQIMKQMVIRRVKAVLYIDSRFNMTGPLSVHTFNFSPDPNSNDMIYNVYDNLQLIQVLTLLSGKPMENIQLYVADQATLLRLNHNYQPTIHTVDRLNAPTLDDPPTVDNITAIKSWLARVRSTVPSGVMPTNENVFHRHQIDDLIHDALVALEKIKPPLKEERQASLKNALMKYIRTDR
ncbi:hypothetical protein BC940DRAFT_297368 [Gongronella butleri]|nr:hypothetical protein BC940DRAFT_297368 [Gongronella butleri]